ncbi:hypothetical protein [Dethiothermospora halolimnae]|uniref:hypothetical protein n=1 Tax=Dethiothermospora halolimnae TaxID=3114390 RepID=UPI003CCBA518
MNKINVDIVYKEETIELYGLSLNSNDRSISKDITDLSKKYYKAVEKNEGEVLPFFTLSRNYNKETKDFNLFIGGILKNDKLHKHVLPQGYYGKIIVKPKLGFLWGLAIGQAKGYFYTKWLPKSNFKGLNFEYEYHTEESISKKPKIEIYFALDKKECM